MHDPMQSYAASVAFPGVTPFGLPYGALQTQGINPTLANPFAQIMGISPAYSGYPTHPLQQLGATSSWQNPLWQNPLFTAGVQNPLLYSGLQNPIHQNPLLQNPIHQNPLLQNQLLQHQLLQNPILQNPFVNPIQAQLQAHAQQLALQAYAAHAGGISPYGVGSPYAQMGSPFTQAGVPPTVSPLAPQTWVGQGGGFGYGQGQPIQPHPLAQAFGRGFQGFQTPGISPWVGF